MVQPLNKKDMYTIILSGIIGIIIGILVTYFDDGYSEDYFSNAFSCGALFAFIGLFLALWLSEETYIKQTSVRIETLQDNSSLSGSFFLGSGQIDGEMSYVMYVKDGDYFQMKIVSYQDAVVKYSKVAKLTTYTRKETDSWINNFAIDLNIHITGYCISVPKGTIKNNYNLDAK